MSHTPGPWRWGYWNHLPTGEPSPGGPLWYPFYKFGAVPIWPRPAELCLSAVPYGTVFKHTGRDAFPNVICARGDEGATIDVSDDDARLIALVPEILDALRELVAQNKLYGFVEPKDVDNALRIIAKVEDTVR